MIVLLTIVLTVLPSTTAPLERIAVFALQNAPSEALAPTLDALKERLAQIRGLWTKTK